MSNTLVSALPQEPRKPGRFEMRHPVDVPHADPDLRDRKDPRYLEFFHGVFLPDITKNGVFVPVILTEVAGVERLADGETRLLAALMAGLKEIPVFIHPGIVEGVDLEIVKFQLNKKRLGMTPIEEIGFYLATMKAKNWTQSKLCDELNLVACIVSKQFKVYDQLAPSLKENLGKGAGKLSLRAAYAICDLPEAKQIEFAEMYVCAAWSISTLENKCRVELRKAPPKERAFYMREDGVEIKITAKNREAAFRKGTDILKRYRENGGEFAPSSN